MFATFFEGIMPGLRSLRPPLFAGSLWGLFLWILLAPQLPTMSAATGWVSQVYAVLETIGAPGIAVVATVGSFLLGVAALAITEPIASLVGRIGATTLDLRDWQFWTRSRRKQLAAQRAQAIEALAKRDSNPAQAASTTNYQERLLRNTEPSHVYYSGFPGAIRRVFTPRTKAAIAAVGERTSSELTAEGAMIERLTSDAFAAAMLKDQRTKHELDFFGRVSGDPDLVAGLHSELGSDPLDALRVLDEKLFLDLDRERGERLVRLAVSFPLIALGCLFGFTFNPILGALAGIAGVILLFRYSAGQSGERARILNLLGLRGAATPSMRSAVLDGENRYREVLSRYKRDEEERSQRKRTET